MRWSLDEPWPLEDNGVYIAIMMIGFAVLASVIVTAVWYLSKIPSSTKGRRGAGCSCPIDESQLVLCAVFVFEAVVFYGPVASPCLEIFNTRPVTLIYWACVALLLSLFTYLETMDPAAKRNPDPLPIACYCDECGEWFQGRHRKHCYNCNKCVLGFDHHCHYINQCIGKENYRPWLLFIMVAFITATWQALLSGYAIFLAFVPDSKCQGNVHHYIGFKLFLAFSCFSVLTLVLGAFALGTLVYEQLRVIDISLRLGAFVSSFMWWGHSYKQEHHIEVIHQALLNWRFAVHQRVIITLRRNYRKNTKNQDKAEEYRMKVSISDRKLMSGACPSRIWALCWCIFPSNPTDDEESKTKRLMHEDEGPLDLTGEEFEVSAYQVSSSKQLDRDFWLMNATLSGYLTWSDLLTCAKCVEYYITEEDCKRMISLAADGDSKGRDRNQESPIRSPLLSPPCIDINDDVFVESEEGKGEVEGREDLLTEAKAKNQGEEARITLSKYRKLMDLTNPIHLQETHLEEVFRFLAGAPSNKPKGKVSINSRSWERALKSMNAKPNNKEGINAAFPPKRANSPAASIDHFQIPRHELEAMIFWATEGKSKAMGWKSFLKALKP